MCYDYKDSDYTFAKGETMLVATINRAIDALEETCPHC